MKKRKFVFVALAVIIVSALWTVPPLLTKKIPFDDTHRELKTTLASEGRKPTEEICRTCHNEKDIPFPKSHRPRSRCLFCHAFDRAD